jgi:hypothetical protein
MSHPLNIWQRRGLNLIDQCEDHKARAQALAVCLRETLPYLDYRKEYSHELKKEIQRLLAALDTP